MPCAQYVPGSGVLAPPEAPATATVRMFQRGGEDEDKRPSSSVPNANLTSDVARSFSNSNDYDGQRGYVDDSRLSTPTTPASSISTPSSDKNEGSQNRVKSTVLPSAEIPKQTANASGVFIARTTVTSQAATSSMLNEGTRMVVTGGEFQATKTVGLIRTVSTPKSSLTPVSASRCSRRQEPSAMLPSLGLQPQIPVPSLAKGFSTAGDLASHQSRGDAREVGIGAKCKKATPVESENSIFNEITKSQMPMSSEKHLPGKTNDLSSLSVQLSPNQTGDHSKASDVEIHKITSVAAAAAGAAAAAATLPQCTYVQCCVVCGPDCPGTSSLGHMVRFSAMVCGAMQDLLDLLSPSERHCCYFPHMPDSIQCRRLSFKSPSVKSDFCRRFYKSLSMKNTGQSSVWTVVETNRAKIIAFGPPTDWPEGIAARVLVGTAAAAAEERAATAMEKAKEAAAAAAAAAAAGPSPEADATAAAAQAAATAANDADATAAAARKEAEDVGPLPSRIDSGGKILGRYGAMCRNGVAYGNRSSSGNGNCGDIRKGSCGTSGGGNSGTSFELVRLYFCRQDAIIEEQENHEVELLGEDGYISSWGDVSAFSPGEMNHISITGDLTSMDRRCNSTPQLCQHFHREWSENILYRYSSGSSSGTGSVRFKVPYQSILQQQKQGKNENLSAAARAATAAAHTVAGSTACASASKGSIPSENSAPDLSSSSTSSSRRHGHHHHHQHRRGMKKNGSFRTSASKVITTEQNGFDLGNVTYGCHCSCGQRTYNEDRVQPVARLHDCLPDGQTREEQAMFYAVYDGHNGEEAVDFIRDNLHKNVCTNEAYAVDDIPTALRCGFAQTDEALRRSVVERIERGGYDPDDVDISPFSSGSTACTVLIRGMTIYIANLGDSRCLVSRAGRAVPLTTDHQLRSNISEQRRVERSGGSYDSDGYLDGALGVSRAFGGFDKTNGSKLRGLTSEPDVFMQTIRREDEFLLLGCDGIFDVLTNQEIITMARSGLRGGESPDKMSKQICDVALQRKSLDNLSVILVVLRNPKQANIPQQGDSYWHWESDDDTCVSISASLVNNRCMSCMQQQQHEQQQLHRTFSTAGYGGNDDAYSNNNEQHLQPQPQIEIGRRRRFNLSALRGLLG